MAENMKFRVKSPKHSQEIQEVLFRCGYSWPGAVPGVKSSDDVEMTDEPFLFANAETRAITYTSAGSEWFFNEHDSEEYVLFEEELVPAYAVEQWELVKRVAPLSPEPPLGLRPRRIVAKERLEEIVAAMQRYTETGKKIPENWISELSEVNNHLGE